MFGTGPMLPILPQPPSLSPSPPPAKRLKRPWERPTASSRRTNHHYRPALNQFSLSLHNLLSGASAEQLQPMAKHGEGSREASSRSIDGKDPFEVRWTIDDVQQMSKEIYDGTIPEVHLSLFGMWIRESAGNYEIAKDHIRELGLDQGYNVDRITNPHVRALLADTYEARPSEPPHAVSTKKHFRFLSSGPKNKPVDKNAPPTTASGFFMFRPKNLVLQPFSHLDSHGAQDSTYPPDTPDRPEPLSIKSRSSNASKTSLPMKDTPRSVSVPFRSRKLHPLPLPRNSVLIQDTMSHPLISPPVDVSTTANSSDSTENADDKTTKNQSDPFIDPDLACLKQSNDSISGVTHSEFDSRDRLGAFRFTDNSVAPGVIYDQLPQDRIAVYTGSDLAAACDDSFVEEEPFDVTDFYAESDDRHSVLESASSTSDYELRTMYKYASSPPRTRPGLDHYLHTAMNPTHPEIQRGNHDEYEIENHHAPHLRSYRSEVNIESTFYRSITDSHHRRAVVKARSSYHIDSESQAMYQTTVFPLPTMSGTRTHAGANVPTPEKHDDPRSVQQFAYDESSDPSTRHGAQKRSGTMDLASFPIPPMRNPVGVLPMLISRAVSPSPTVRMTRKVEPTATHATTSSSEAYRAITKMHMIAALQKSRSRGAKLPKVDWDRLSPADQKWRRKNETILLSVYGSQAVMLTQHDVDYVNCISQEILSDGDEMSANEWVLRIFQGNT